MAKLYLKLENDDGSFREFKKEKIKAYWVKKALQHTKRLTEMGEKEDPDTIIDERLNFTCEVFGDKELTPDAILNGIRCDELIPFLDLVINTVMGNDMGDKEKKGK